jgi:hypothetical protein
MPNETHCAPLRYNIPDFFSSLLDLGKSLQEWEAKSWSRWRS